MQRILLALFLCLFFSLTAFADSITINVTSWSFIANVQNDIPIGKLALAGTDANGGIVALTLNTTWNPASATNYTTVNALSRGTDPNAFTFVNGTTAYTGGLDSSAYFMSGAFSIATPGISATPAAATLSFSSPLTIFTNTANPTSLLILNINNLIGTASVTAINSASTSFQAAGAGAAAVPEPATLILLGSGLVGAVIQRRRKIVKI